MKTAGVKLASGTLWEVSETERSEGGVIDWEKEGERGRKMDREKDGQGEDGIDESASER